MLEPADHGLPLDPDDDQLVVELAGVLLLGGIGDGRAVGHDGRHRVADDVDATALAAGGEPLRARGLAGVGPAARARIDAVLGVGPRRPRPHGGRPP